MGSRVPVSAPHMIAIARSRELIRQTSTRPKHGSDQGICSRMVMQHQDPNLI
jgi:hypothetical protein